jgi:hypothetical protein
VCTFENRFFTSAFKQKFYLLFIASSTVVHKMTSASSTPQILGQLSGLVEELNEEVELREVCVCVRSCTYRRVFADPSRDNAQIYGNCNVLYYGFFFVYSRPILITSRHNFIVAFKRIFVTLCGGMHNALLCLMP